MQVDERLEQMRIGLEKTKGLLSKMNSNLDDGVRDLFQNMSPEEVAEYVHKNNAHQAFGRYLNQLQTSPERAFLLGEAFDNYAAAHKK